MRWHKVELVCSRANANNLEEILVDIGAISISMTNKSKKDIYEPGVGETPLWDLINISALFEQKILEEDIASALNLIEYTDLSISELEETNWIEKYQENFKPIKISERLWIVPTWSQMPKNPGRIELKIDPGIAFGSGSHETTQLCLEYLERAKLNDLTILDYGCGSGILSIASLLLGAGYVIASDIDPQALESTKENSKKNKVNKKIEIVHPSLIPNVQIDLLVANIFLNTLIDYRDIFFTLLKSGAIIVLSGIMKSQLNLVLGHYQECFIMRNYEIKNNWCLIEFERT